MAEISTIDVLAKEAHATNGVELSREGDVRALYRKLNELNRAAICLSGGGDIMPGIPRALITGAERRFPVRIRIAIPPEGLGRQHALGSTRTAARTAGR